MFEFKMPTLGADMEKGILASWHVHPGDAVKKGDIIADVETDKGTIEVEIWESGEVKQLLVAPGQEVPVGTRLALLENVTGDVSLPSLPPSIPATKFTETPHSRRVSPLARRLAKEMGIDISLLKPNEVDGTIGKPEVEKALSELKMKSQLPISEPSRENFEVKKRVSEVSTKSTAMRNAIAAAMAKSKREIPHYYLKTDIDMTNSMDWLASRNARLSVTERLLPIVLLIKAVSLALSEFPQFNGTFQNGEFLRSTEVNLGMAISLRGGGLLSPVIHNAHKKNLPEIMQSLSELVQRSRTGKLRSSDLENPSATITNLGDTGVDSVFGVIHPPQVAMLGIGRVSERPWSKNGGLFVAPILTMTLAADHRVSDGHEGALFLSKIDSLLQTPDAL